MRLGTLSKLFELIILPSWSAISVSFDMLFELLTGCAITIFQRIFLLYPSLNLNPQKVLQSSQYLNKPFSQNRAQFVTTKNNWMHDANLSDSSNTEKDEHKIGQDKDWECAYYGLCALFLWIETCRNLFTVLKIHTNQNMHTRFVWSVAFQQAFNFQWEMAIRYHIKISIHWNDFRKLSHRFQTSQRLRKKERKWGVSRLSSKYDEEKSVQSDANTECKSILRP